MSKIVPTMEIDIPEVMKNMKPLRSPTGMVHLLRQRAKEKWLEYLLNRHRSPYESWDQAEREQAEFYG